MNKLRKILLGLGALTVTSGCTTFAQQAATSWGIKSAESGAYGSNNVKSSSMNGIKWGAGKEQYGESWNKVSGVTITNSEAGNKGVIHATGRSATPQQKDTKTVKTSAHDSSFRFKSVKMRPPSRNQLRSARGSGAKPLMNSTDKKGNTLKTQSQTRGASHPNKAVRQ